MVETVRYGRMMLQDIDKGLGRREVRLQDGRVVLLDQIHAGRLLQSVNLSGLPTPDGTNGMLFLQNGFGGLALDTGRIWWPQNNRVVFPESPQFGAYGDGVHDDTEAIQACIDYVATNHYTMQANGLYLISETIVFPSGRGYGVSFNNLVTFSQFCPAGLIWGGGDNDVMVEILECAGCTFDSLIVSDVGSNGLPKHTNLTGILIHNSDDAIVGGVHNLYGRVSLYGLQTGLQIGDYTNDGYDSNIEACTWWYVHAFGVVHPLLIDSDNQDDNRIEHFFNGGPTTISNRNYVIRILRNGGGLVFGDLFLSTHGMVEDLAAVDVLGGSFTVDNWISIEGTPDPNEPNGVSRWRAIDFSSNGTRYTSTINGLAVSKHIKDTQDRCVFINADVVVAFRDCVCAGDVEVSSGAYARFDNMQFYEDFLNPGTYPFGIIGGGDWEDDATIDINVAVARPQVDSRRGNRHLSTLDVAERLTIGDRVGMKARQTPTADLTSGSPYTWGSFTMEANAGITAELHWQLYRGAGNSRAARGSGTFTYTARADNATPANVVTTTYGYYKNLTGTHNGAGNAAALTDTTVDFVKLGVRIGDLLRNTADGSRVVITGISTTTNPNDTLAGTLAGGVQNDWDVGDTYAIEQRQQASMAWDEDEYTNWTIIPTIAVTGASNPLTVTLGITQTNALVGGGTADAMFLAYTVYYTMNQSSQTHIITNDDDFTLTPA